MPQSLVVAVPPAPGGEVGSPTGIVFSGSTDFVVGNGTTTGASRFIFATEDGTISGWAPNVDLLHAIVTVHKPGSSYKGLALAASANGNQLYAADFRNGRIDVFDKNFAPVATTGKFVDKQVPVRYAPFNIQAINGELYVAYAKRDARGEEEKTGPRMGFINVFDTDGHRLRRLVLHRGLNAPWGFAMAPADFGDFSNALLVGNFGDGTVSGYRPDTGRFIGTLRGADGQPLQVDGLWGMAFGNGLFSQGKNVLYFAAGPVSETAGLYGSISLAGEQGVGH